MRIDYQANAGADFFKTLPKFNWRLETGSTAVISLIFISSVMLLVLAVTLATSLAHGNTRLQVVADAASLSAADTVRGLVSGIPCENAERIAVSNGAFLDSCRIVGTDVSIRVTKFTGVTELSASSVAGSPNE